MVGCSYYDGDFDIVVSCSEKSHEEQQQHSECLACLISSSSSSSSSFSASTTFDFIRPRESTSATGGVNLTVGVLVGCAIAASALLAIVVVVVSLIVAKALRQLDGTAGRFRTCSASATTNQVDSCSAAKTRGDSQSSTSSSSLPDSITPLPQNEKPLRADDSICTGRLSGCLEQSLPGECRSELVVTTQANPVPLRNIVTTTYKQCHAEWDCNGARSRPVWIKNA